MTELRARVAAPSYDAIVVGAGPNGLAAAIALGHAGLAVLVVEAGPTIGGGARSAERTLPGFVSDVCSAIHPTAFASPFFRTLPLGAHGVEWIQPDAPLAHPLDGGHVAVLERDLDAMRARLGDDDADAWKTLFSPLIDAGEPLFDDLLAPLRVPTDPFALAGFGLSAMQSASGLARGRFRGVPAQALLAGCAAHSVLPLERAFSAAFALVLALAGHRIGWPFPRGGSQRLVDALAAIARAAGVEIVTDHVVTTLAEVPDARAILFDTTPGAMARIAGDVLPASYRARLAKFRFGPGVFKVDWALDGPIPWKNQACMRAATVHVGGTLDEIAASERACWQGELIERPFVLVAQQSVFDPTRAPAGKHVGWAYCHVPSRSTVDATDRIESQIERFAPGFRERILARATITPAQLEAYDANYVGGDITGGANVVDQLFTRPVAAAVPYATPNPRLFLCSSSTPPGGGVHGMCGWFAARAALSRVFGRAVGRDPQPVAE